MAPQHQVKLPSPPPSQTDQNSSEQGTRFPNGASVPLALYLPEKKRLQLEAHHKDKVKQRKIYAESGFVTAEAIHSHDLVTVSAKREESENKRRYSTSQSSTSPAMANNNMNPYQMNSQNYGYPSGDSFQQGSSMSSGQAADGPMQQQQQQQQFYGSHPPFPHQNSASSNDTQKITDSNGPNGAGSGLTNQDVEIFEFMKRKRWPQLLMQELVGAAVWCLVPYQGSAVSASGSTSGWKVVFASPASFELLGWKPEELEGRDWAEMVYPVDLPRLLHSITTTISPATSPSRGCSALTYQTSNSRSSSETAFDPGSVPPVGLGRFAVPSRPMSVYSRLLNKSGREVLFELRGHAYFGEEDTPETPESAEDNGGFDGGGVMGVSRHGKERVPPAANPVNREEDRPCKAFWVMGRKWTGQGEGGGKMLDSFLELKLENERLRQELRDLQTRPYNPRQSVSASRPYMSSSMGGSFSGFHMDSVGGFGGRKGEFGEDDDEENSSGRQSPSGGDPNGRGGDEKKPKKPKNGKQPEYLCRNCGRNDSPEWRKGPLGAKTLCNACGLRWAKRNAGPTPKKPKDGKPKEKGDQPQEHKQEGMHPGVMAPQQGHMTGLT